MVNYLLFALPIPVRTCPMHTYAYVHIHTNSPQRYEKKMNYANNFTKKYDKSKKKPFFLHCAASALPLFSLHRASSLRSLFHGLPHKKGSPSRAFSWYPEPGSNRHGLLHWCLRPARLPIPPSGHHLLYRTTARNASGERGIRTPGTVTRTTV